MKSRPDGLAESKERRRGAAALCLKIAASIWLKAQYRLSASASFIWAALQRLGLLPGPVQTPLAGPHASLEALGARGPTHSLRGRTLAWASHLLRRWLGLLHARHTRFTEGVRPASGTTAGVWLSCRPSARPVSCWYRSKQLIFCSH